ncbi:carboxylesterase/lipase family protein [Shouchella patagoniensis]|uniref:carboxylesterase/lipase family protein n=1 Tax=Shouchella patagoniensis TaxID=228576 RepID=UPI0009958A81|nr:carboxylesterase/lipase family protein [Shouchella patagoniensis]
MGSLQIQTDYGTIDGVLEKGIRSWKGIPYAEPPVEDRRFKAPVPKKCWAGVLKADSFGPVCPQPESGAAGLLGEEMTEGEVQSEDCLYLNVWAPVDAKEASLPVMVWIHGGAFVTGSGSLPIYDGAPLAERGNVVVVTINYRLGPFGFMHMSPFGEEFVSNAGLLDQIAALQWVKDQIAPFGGNPTNMTVFGESAGSMSIAGLLAMPMAKGLFNKAIMQSGASQSLSDPKGKEVAMGMLQILELEVNDVHRLKNIPAKRIVEAGLKLTEKLGSGGLTMLFQPVVEANTLPLPPIEAIIQGQAKDIPLLIGTNLHEGLLFFREDMQLPKKEDVLKGMKVMAGGAEQLDTVLAEYPGTAKGYADMMTDLYFWRSSLAFASEQNKHAAVYMYRFDWTYSDHPVLKDAVHAAELFFVFNHLHLFERVGVSIDEQTRKLANSMQDAWANFAAAGTPTSSNIPWPQYEQQGRKTLIFDREMGLVEDPMVAKRKALGL